MMVQCEAARRLDNATQLAYACAEAGDDDRSWLEVTEELQHDVVREFGYASGSARVTAAALRALRGAAARHPEHAFWVRYNRARRGALRAGDAAPDVSLARVDAATTTPARLPRDFVPTDGRPLAVVALSYS